MPESILKNITKTFSPFLKNYVRKQGEIAIQIDEFRKKKGISQKDLAEKLGKKPSFINRVLSGGSNITLKTIVEFETFFNEDIITIPIFSTYNLETSQEITESIIATVPIKFLPKWLQYNSPYFEGDATVDATVDAKYLYK